MTKNEEFELAALNGQFSDNVLHVRDQLQKIVDGEIERGHCSPGTRECYGGRPGKRKLTLKDARGIAKHMIAFINRIVNEFHDAESKLLK